MTPERWKQIDRLLAEALIVPDAERAAFLAEACGDDVALHGEVVSLLAAHQEAEADFLSTSPVEGAIKELATEPNPSLVGKTLGPYRLLSVLGIGGMGEVYLARDERLKRQLALKILPPHFVADAGRVERFAREARAVSALNHPNIVTVYDIGQLDGTHFIAMEHVDGHTLREKILAAKQAPADVKEVIEVALQITAALSAAHAAGIIHRDIKPENVMVRHDDYVKVLDFGLAKLTEGQREGGHHQTTAPLSLPARPPASLLETAPGTVLGTVRYMSPEQAQGGNVDARSDIFSLGVVLYEWLTGSAPFKGDTVATTLDAVLHHTPLPIRQRRPDLSAACASLIHRILEKDRDLRHPSADDLRAAFKQLKRELDSSPSNSLKSGERGQASAVSWPTAKIALATAAALLFIAVAAWRWWPSATAEPSPWLTASNRRLTAFPGEERDVSLSPEGKRVFYAHRVQGQWDIFWQRIGGSNPTNLTEGNDADDMEPVCSPNGASVAFRSERDGGGLFVMGASGENVRRLTNFGHNPSWSPDGREIVCGTTYIFNPKLPGAKSSLVAIQLDSGMQRVLRDGKDGEDAAQPQWSPNGKRIAYYRNRRDIWTMAADGSDPRPVTDDAAVDWNPIWSSDGQYLYFASDRKTLASLWRVRIDEITGRTLGQPEPVTGPTADVIQMDIARDGRSIVYVVRVQDANLKAIGFDSLKLSVTGETVPITQGTSPFGSPNLSPDGQWVAFHSFGAAREDVWLRRADGSGAITNLTDDASLDRFPRWSPDGKQLAFGSDRTGLNQIWLMNPDGSNKRPLTFTDKGCSAPFWSPDGRRIAYQLTQQNTAQPIQRGTQIIETDKPWTQQTPVTLPAINDAGDWFIGLTWSPDSKYIVGHAVGLQGHEVRTKPGLFLYSFDTNRYQQLTTFGTRAEWLADSRHLVFTYPGKGKTADQQVYLVDTKTKKTTVLLRHPTQVISTLGLTRDNRRLFYTATDHQSDLFLLSLDK